MTIVKQPIRNNSNLTWEMAAYESTEELYSDISLYKSENDFTSDTDSGILNLRQTIDLYINSKLYLESDGVGAYEHKAKWRELSSSVIHIAKCFDSTYLMTSSEILNTVISKQRDYGHKNISKFGITGLVIRVHDKVARVENLMKKENYVNAVLDETMLDTLMDIIGYSIIAYMWLNNTFLYELGDKK